MNRRVLEILIALTAVLSAGARADVEADVVHLQSRWAEVNYQLEGKTQVSAFEQLVAEADSAVDAAPDSAALLIWSGIIKSTYAGAKGGLGALSVAKEARADFEAAMKIDADALEGSAYTSLGILMHSVPGWPVGFGSDKEARKLLLTGVEKNPEGIDNNYFYAAFLLDEKEYDEAEEHFLRAQAAPARPGREIADKGRQEEIREALAGLHAKR
ncbi:MAG: hypothetical protein P1V29_00290 [Gammaproteobacteria bacterium]|jgi:tetratricopeptide (TPR) repeat protein|nr:hypothetical protein [Gammaproteobacteria bacterium]